MSFRLFAVALLIVLNSCVAPAPKPAPPPVNPIPPRAAPPPVVAAGSDWRDWPVTPGDWRYASASGGSAAHFGLAGAPPLLTLTCDLARRQVGFAKLGAGPQVTVRTSTTLRALALVMRNDGYGVAVLAANDPLLDAMGFSRGRFVIEQTGMRALVIPAWPEILRVTEDCRG